MSELSETEAAVVQQRTRSNFANRLLTKELNVRKKTTQEIKISPADAAKFAAPPEAEKKESATV
jgi:hypothetical protein